VHYNLQDTEGNLLKTPLSLAVPGGKGKGRGKGRGRPPQPYRLDFDLSSVAIIVE
ncbi:Hypothetical protein FKW44_014525, partial [Caligus rogercresseyi]